MCTSTDNQSDSNAPLTGQFLAAVRLGMPSHRCTNYGICHIEAINPAQGGESSDLKSSVQAIITVYDTFQIEIAFLRKTMSQALIDNHFNDDQFLVMEDYHYIDSSGQLPTFSILTGSYSVTHSDQYLNVPIMKKKINT
jgi:hypothetical protein